MKQLRARRKAEDQAAARVVLTPAPGEDQICPLCGRAMVAGQSLNAHHLIPRMFGGRHTAVIHRICHGKIHAVFTEAELAREYHTFERLRAHDAMAKFIKWVRRQPPELNAKHARPKTR